MFFSLLFQLGDADTLHGDRVCQLIDLELEGGDPTKEVLAEYADPDSEKYAAMVKKIGEKLHFTSLRYHRLDDMIASVGIPADQLCTYCWNGKE